MAGIFADAAMQEWKRARDEQIDRDICTILPFSEACSRKT